MSPPESLPDWTEGDELRLLKAVLAMADEPAEDFDPSVSPLDRLGRALVDRPGASREDILAKVKHLRRSYEEERRRIGARASSAVFEISHRIWGRPAATRPAPRQGKKSKQSKAKPKPKENGGKLTVAEGARRCAHCAATKTPQWRNGPMGPRTLCNACGVRYNKGRLVPEYRPAASPTFVASQHSNNHRQIMELRRRKEKVGGSGEFVGSGGVRRELVY